MSKSETCQDAVTLVWKSKTETYMILDSQTNETQKSKTKRLPCFQVGSKVSAIQGAIWHP